jgi:hypothetical protein
MAKKSKLLDLVLERKPVAIMLLNRPGIPGDSIL